MQSAAITTTTTTTTTDGVTVETVATNGLVIEHRILVAHPIRAGLDLVAIVASDRGRDAAIAHYARPAA